MTVERRDGPTLAGGVASEAIYDDEGRLVEIVEYDEDGMILARTYAAEVAATPDRGDIFSSEFADLSDEELVLRPLRDGMSKAEVIERIVETTGVDGTTAIAIFHKARGDAGYEGAPL